MSNSPFARRAGALMATLVLAACATNPRPRRPEARPPAKIGARQEGTASWYGPDFNGRRTACGERFDQEALTAAHGSWPCGTRVKVTFLMTGRSVVVRVNDLFRGHKGRVIDLSKGAARAIGLLGPGTGRVRLEVVR